MNSVATVNTSLESLQKKIKARKRKLAEIDLAIEGTIEKISTSDNLSTRTDLALLRAERTNLSANIFFLEQEEARLKSAQNDTPSGKPSLEESEERSYYN